MVPENYNYSEFKLPEQTCANCERRNVAFHLIMGTSFCTFHNARTQSSIYHTCENWKKDEREKPTWTQDIIRVFNFPVMEEIPEITTFYVKGNCPTCKNCGNVDFYYCNKYYEELKGQERTCKMCQVDTFGKCDFYEPKETVDKNSNPPKTEKAGIRLGNSIFSAEPDEEGNLKTKFESVN